MYLLIASGLACAVIGWLARAATGEGREDRAYEDGATAAGLAERAHREAWDREFSLPRLGDFVDRVLDETPTQVQLHTYADAADLASRGTCHELDVPETAERMPTVAEMRDKADAALCYTELGAQLVGFREWYDREFQTGQFGAVRA
jgi:hypothetical protein